MPPTDNQTNVGCIITDSEGYVMGVTKKDLLIDPENIITTDTRISVPSVNEINQLKRDEKYPTLHIIPTRKLNTNQPRQIKGYTPRSR